MKKYELIKESKTTFMGRVIYRIRALKDFGNVKAGKIITFEEALKEMEQGKVCRSLYSGAEYLLSNNHFEKLNRNYTTLSYKEIKEGWVVVNE